MKLQRREFAPNLMVLARDFLRPAVKEPQQKAMGNESKKHPAKVAAIIVQDIQIDIDPSPNRAFRVVLRKCEKWKKTKRALPLLQLLIDPL